MHNAHQRMGQLTFIRQKGDSITNVSVHLNQLVAERPERPSAATAFHLISVFGGDVEIGAVAAAVHEGLRFQVEGPGLGLLGTLGAEAVLYRSSLQVPGRKRPVRHLVGVSKDLFETTFGATGEVRRTVLYESTPEFVLHRLAVRFGLPVQPEWSEWFYGELTRRGMVEPLIGLNCAPVAVKGTKLRMLRLLGTGLRRNAISVDER